MISTADLKWVAGFLEGEGSFYSHKNTRTLAVQATQVQKWPLETLQRLLGGKIYLRVSKRENQNDCWSWYLGTTDSAALMMTLFSLMSPKRKVQITKALASWRSYLPAAENRGQCPQGHVYTEENTRWIVRTNGQRERQCITCHKIQNLDYYRREKEKYPCAADPPSNSALAP